MNKMFLLWMESDNIGLAIIATVRASSDLYISANEIPSIFVPFSDQLLQMVHLMIPMRSRGFEETSRRCSPSQSVLVRGARRGSSRPTSSSVYDIRP